MNYLDLIIIYLACGSPLGVYYFFNNKLKGTKIWLKSIFVAFLWIPYAVILLHGKVTNILRVKGFDSEKDKILFLQKQIENYLPKSSDRISFFEFREVIERYTELTLVSSKFDLVPAKHEFEIYRLQGNKNAELSAICLHRRNKKKLENHQINARDDFLDALRYLFKTYPNNNILKQHSIKFAKILNDETTQLSINELFEESLQIPQETTVTNAENELWKPIEQ